MRPEPFEAGTIRIRRRIAYFTVLCDLPNDLRTQAPRIAPVLQDQPRAAGAKREIDDRQS